MAGRSAAPVPLAALALAASLAALAPAAGAQEHPGHSEHAGKEVRDIKALSPERVQELLSGSGAGYALPAERNHYPGPRHVLDLRDDLALTPGQVEDVSRVFDAMQAKALELGRRLVDLEGRMELAFRAGDLSDAELAGLVQRAAQVEGELRLAHLSAHLATRARLTAVQVERYDALRGYAARPGDGASGLR